MSFRLCRHIKTGGQQCQSPSMLQASFCYFHQNFRRRNRPPGDQTTTMHPVRDAHGNFNGMEPQNPSGAALDLGLLEDAASVQVAISTVVNALAGNRVEMRRATALLYGLQLAAINCRNLAKEIPCRPDQLLQETTPDASGEEIAREGLFQGDRWVNKEEPPPYENDEQEEEEYEEEEEEEGDDEEYEEEEGEEEEDEEEYGEEEGEEEYEEEEDEEEAEEEDEEDAQDTDEHERCDEESEKAESGKEDSGADRNEDVGTEDHPSGDSDATRPGRDVHRAPEETFRTHPDELSSALHQLLTSMESGFCP